MERVAVVDNLIVVGGGPGGIFDGNARMVQILQDVHDVTVARNTAVGDLGSVAKTQVNFDGSNPATRVAIFDNVFGPAQYSVSGNGTSTIAATLAKFAPGAQLTNNVLTGIISTQQITGNWYPSTIATAGLAGTTIGNYAFDPTATSFASALVGRQTGVDMTTLNAVTAGVTVP